jgi:N-acetylglutamate synthase-like GNAT family acetyltransferase
MQKEILKKGAYIISTNDDQLDINMIHQYLSEESYWSKGIPLEIVKQSITNSLNFGIYKGEQQIGFARVITDKTTMAYLCDVFIIKDFQRKGLSSWLMKIIMEYPELQGLKRWILLTSSADWLYEKHGFTKLEAPENYMEKWNKINYQNV